MQSWELSPLLPVPSVQLFSASHNAFQMDHFLKCIKLLKIQYGCCIAFQLVLFLTTFLELLSEPKLMVGSIISHLNFFRQYVIKTRYIQAHKMNQTLWRVRLGLALLAGGGGSWTEGEKKHCSSKLGETGNDQGEQGLINHKKGLKTSKLTPAIWCSWWHYKGRKLKTAYIENVESLGLWF